MSKSPEIWSMEWEYEDNLPELTDLEYDLMYQYSKLVDSVRMFPYTKYWCQCNDREIKVYLGA